jgi:HD-GYP domain-containing protein (c-di-GMP phosphodiesterase class II)
MTLSSISDFLRSHELAQHADIFLFDAQGRALGTSVQVDPERASSASTQDSETALQVLHQLSADKAQHGRLLEKQFDGETRLFYTIPPIDDLDDPARSGSLYFGITASLDSVAAPYLHNVKWSILVSGGILLLLLPMSWLFANPIVRPVRQLALENDKVRLRKYDEVQRVESNVQELDDLSHSMVAMVTAIQAHEVAQRELMDSFIQLIARAIDDKSPYTAGHCARVPVLAMMLAEHASKSNLPAFSGFSMHTDDQWREYRIAAWLHDCGKITTPEHIVDKGSKLETIYNRIHEVRMRFEVLWRDAEITYLRELAESPDEESELIEALEQRRAQLQQDWEFLAACNVGAEYLDDAQRERLHSIAESQWERHFDDRLGLSPLEELRLQGRSTNTLPTTENLLSDKPEHIVDRSNSTDYPPELGINMDVPEHLYNLGELYNLSVSRGTLTTEDRFKINEHMISTIRMLESLPFPPELRNVPRWASTHHETMSGTGYPRRLPGAALSVPERIMAVADVFEALTAADRPYKKAKNISVAIDILHQMVLDNHIDRDCFELFISNEVYLEYAHRFLAPEQIDKVDLSKYLGSAG